MQTNWSIYFHRTCHSYSTKQHTQLSQNKEAQCKQMIRWQVTLKIVTVKYESLAFIETDLKHKTGNSQNYISHSKCHFYRYMHISHWNLTIFSRYFAQYQLQSTEFISVTYFGYNFLTNNKVRALSNCLNYPQQHEISLYCVFWMK